MGRGINGMTGSKEGGGDFSVQHWKSGGGGMKGQMGILDERGHRKEEYR